MLNLIFKYNIYVIVDLGMKEILSSQSNCLIEALLKVWEHSPVSSRSNSISRSPELPLMSL